MCPLTSPLKKTFNKAFGANPVIRLENGFDSAAIIHGNWNKDNLQNFEDCTFMVDSNIYRGDDTQAVYRGLTFSIKSVNLRMDPKNNECIDYIRFTFGASGAQTDKICGTIDDKSNEYMKYFSLLDPNGVVKVHVFVNKSVSYEHSYGFNTDVQLAFTAYEGMLCDLILFNNFVYN